MKKLKYIILFLGIVLLGLSACAQANKPTDDSNPSHGDPQQGSSFYCEYEAEKETYDINNVTLKLTYGFKNREVVELFYRQYCKEHGCYDEWYDENGIKKPEYEDVEPSVRIYLFFLSFGNKHLIKTVDDFFTDEYLGKNHSEEITVPAELFYNEYGLIRFRYTDDSDGESGLFLLPRTECSIYYKKVGDTVYISDKDLAPPYEYQFGKTEKNTGKIYNRDLSSRQDYCGYKAKLSRYVSDRSNFPVQFYFGRIYDTEEKNIPAVDIYIVSENDKCEENRILVKTIDDYMSDEYRCIRTYDYYGNIREIIYCHNEIIEIPYYFFEGESGTIKFIICETSTQNELTEISLSYALSGYIREPYQSIS